jgi:hypothetical protein
VPGNSGPGRRLGLLLVGTHGRLQIATRRSVTVKALAVLAGLTQRAVYRQARLEPLDYSAKPLRYPAAAARRWLHARGVAGFDRP